MVFCAALDVNVTTLVVCFGRDAFSLASGFGREPRCAAILEGKAAKRKNVNACGFERTEVNLAFLKPLEKKILKGKVCNKKDDILKTIWK